MTLWLVLAVLWLYNAYLISKMVRTTLYIREANKDLRRVNA